jgi:hypothetical protein
MKFYFHNFRGEMIEYTGCEYLVPVKSNLSGRGYMKEDPQNISGWIFEGDEYFQSYCMIRFGFSPAEITDAEYNQLVTDKVTFFSRERTNKIRRDVAASVPFKVNNG